MTCLHFKKVTRCSSEVQVSGEFKCNSASHIHFLIGQLNLVVLLLVPLPTSHLLLSPMNPAFCSFPSPQAWSPPKVEQGHVRVQCKGPLSTCAGPLGKPPASGLQGGGLNHQKKEQRQRGLHAGPSGWAVSDGCRISVSPQQRGCFASLP